MRSDGFWHRRPLVLKFYRSIRRETRLQAPKSLAERDLDSGADTQPQSIGGRSVDDSHFHAAATTYKRDEGAGFGVAVRPDELRYGLTADLNATNEVAGG